MFLIIVHSVEGSSRIVRSASVMLGEREEVAVRILEPGDPCPAWRGPYAVGVLVEERVQLERHATPRQFRHYIVQVRHGPPEGSIGVRHHLLDLLDPELD